MSYHPDKELVGLLGELGEQAERTLLAVRTHAGRMDEPVSPRMAGLSSLEREILLLHREEAAHLLNWISHLCSYEEQASILSVGHWMSATRYAECPDRTTMSSRIDLVLEAELGLPLASRKLLGEGLQASSSMGAAAEASLQVMTTSYAHLQLSTSALIQGRAREGAEHARRALPGLVQPDHRNAALLDLGLALMLLGEGEQAEELCFRPARRRGTSMPSMCLFGLISAVHHGGQAEAQRAVELIDVNIRPGHLAIGSFLERLTNGRLRDRLLKSETSSLVHELRLRTEEVSDHVVRGIQR